MVSIGTTEYTYASQLILLVLKKTILIPHRPLLRAQVQAGLWADLTEVRMALNIAGQWQGWSA
jgi:hypothetical protein